MAAKWIVQADQAILVGKLDDVHHSGSGDGDSSVNIIPDAAHAALLVNRSGHENENGQVECEICVGSSWSNDYEDCVKSLLGATVTAVGVFVDDTEHSDKTELHPLDLVFAPVGSSRLATDWIGGLASQQHLSVGTTLLAWRFAAASDVRGDDGRPPLGSSTRAVTFTLPFPPHPRPPVRAAAAPIVVGAVAPVTGVQVFLQGNATIATHVRTQGTGTVVDVTVTCLGRDDGGPGVLAGEIVTYWGAPTPAILVSPRQLSFAAVVGESVDRSFSIQSVGLLPLHVTIAGSPITHPFRWPQIDTTVAPGSSIEVTVEFIARGAGQVSGTVPVQSNAPPGSLSVALTARATSRILPH